MRLIDADALIESIEQSKGKNSIYAQFVRAYTKDAPTIDAVQVVRCMVCKHSRKDELWHMRWCKGLTVKDEHFCADGERKDNEID